MNQQQVSVTVLLEGPTSIRSKGVAESDGRNATRRDQYADAVVTRWLYAMDTPVAPTTDHQRKAPSGNSSPSVYSWLNHGD